MSYIRTVSFGGEGGDVFSMAVFKELGLRTDRLVDQISLNNVPHGRNGGKDRGSLTLSSEEYFSKVEIRHDKMIDSVTFHTNKGRSIGGGGTGGVSSTIDNARIMAVGGKSGKYVDNLRIMFIEDYKASTVVAKGQGFILSYSAPFQEFEEYTDSIYRTADSYEKVTEHMLSQTYKASVEGEYYVKVAASTEIGVKDSTLETIKKELQTELKSGKKVTQKIPEGHVGIKLVTGTVMKGAVDDEHWMFPTSETSYSVIKITDVKNLLDRYDLTGQLDTQMPELKQYKKEKYGYVYYGE